MWCSDTVVVLVWANPQNMLLLLWCRTRAISTCVLVSCDVTSTRNLYCSKKHLVIDHLKVPEGKLLYNWRIYTKEKNKCTTFYLFVCWVSFWLWHVLQAARTWFFDNLFLLLIIPTSNSQISKIHLVFNIQYCVHTNAINLSNLLLTSRISTNKASRKPLSSVIPSIEPIQSSNDETSHPKRYFTQKSLSFPLHP